MNANNLFPLPPDIAIAYFQLGLLSSTDLVTLADTWLNQGIYTDSINFLQMDKDPIMSEASKLFIKAMEEMDVSVPTRVAAAWLVTEDIMKRISSRSIDLMEGVNFIYWDVHHEIDTELPDGKYLGSNLKLEQVFCWLREVWDCRDGSRLIAMRIFQEPMQSVGSIDIVKSGQMNVRFFCGFNCDFQEVK